MPTFDPNDPLGQYYWNHTDPDDDFDEREAFRRALRSMLVLLVVMLACLGVSALFSGCTTTRTVTVERTTHDTIQITRQQRDSIYLRDSIYVRERTQGDTVFMEVTRWHTQYRDRWHHDSIYAVRVDSVPVPYPVEKRVPAQLSWLQQMQIWVGRLVLIAIALAAAVWLLRRYIKSRMKLP